jgi:hypothetical protein
MIYRKDNISALLREAAQIAKELGDIVFVGAIPVYLYTKRDRVTRDLDFVITNKITVDELIMKRYHISRERGKEIIRSPRGCKIDMYDKDVSGIPVERIFQTSREVNVGKRDKIKITSPEVMIVAKHVASRPQDNEDLYYIAQTILKKIDEELLRQLVEYNEYKFQEIMRTLKALSDFRNR